MRWSCCSRSPRWPGCSPRGGGRGARRSSSCSGRPPGWPRWPDRTPATLAAAPAVVGAVAGLLTLRELVRRLPGAPGRPAPEGVQRRAFLQATAAAGALGVVGVVARAGDRRRRARCPVRAGGDPDPPRRPRPRRPVPAGVDVGVDGVGPWQTPADEFYRIDTALVVPQVDPSTWTLRVHGMVEQEVTLTWDELLAGDLVEAWVTLACVSNPVGGDLIGNQKWLGLPIADLLARARPTADADMVLSRSVDGFTASTPLAALTDGRDALLAIAMDGEPLPVEHGFPVRMVVPGLYGYVSATKWVTELRVTRFADATAYWTDRGWSPEGPIKTQSRIEVPRPSSVGPRRVRRRGRARRGRSTGGSPACRCGWTTGSWNDATLADDGGIDSWRQWSWTWERRARRVPAVRPRVRPAGPPDGCRRGRHPGRRHGLRHGPRHGHLTGAPMSRAATPARGRREHPQWRWP